LISAHLTIDPHFVVGPINRRLFGSFVEHLGRCVYDGIYEPGHPEADENGFRRDVIELVKELGVSTIRYPGGNFVSGYRWEDGVGDRGARPRRLDLAWHSLETNEIGLDEFAVWLDKVGSELMYAVNLGTRGVQEALDVLEYANVRGGTELSDRRIANGAAEPYDIRMWCLGNEMDGPWQLGHGTPRAYGRLAMKTARAMRQIDPGLELVVCGSSSAQMPLFGTWERIVLEETYDEVDFISCHAYYEPFDGDWYHSRYTEVDRITDPQEWPVAPRLLEDVYSVVDAVVFGSLLISLVRHADRVTAASLAQLVNVIAPIMTEPGGPAWRQTTFFPFAVMSRLARGVALELKLDCPTYETERHGTAGVVDAVATHDAESGETAVFLVNRSLTEAAEFVIDAALLGDVKVTAADSLYDSDMHAANTLADPERVKLRPNESARVADGEVRIVLPPVSWTAMTLR
jgi:alpha-N-arabinofuranosidase